MKKSLKTAMDQVAVSSVHLLADFWEQAWNAGLTLEDLSTVINNSVKMDELVRFWKGYPAESLAWDEAPLVMDGQIIGLNKAERLGLSVSLKLQERFNIVPFSRRTLLVAASSGQILVAMPEVDLYTLLVNKGELFALDSRLDGQEFLRQKSRPGYHLVYPWFLGSNHQTNFQQVMGLPAGYNPLSAVEFAYLAAAYRLERKGNPYIGYVRCKDAIGGMHIQLGFENRNDGPIFISLVDDIEASSILGISAGIYRPLASLP